MIRRSILLVVFLVSGYALGNLVAHLVKAPFGKWTTMTFIAAFRCDRIEAPCLFDGPINGEAFLAYVRTLLVPTLKAGDLVIMDNLGSHRGKLVRKAIRAAGAKFLFLSKYSPDLNPIEQVLSKLKQGLRKAQARSYDGLLAATAELIDTYLHRLRRPCLHHALAQIAKSALRPSDSSAHSHRFRYCRDGGRPGGCRSPRSDERQCLKRTPMRNERPTTS